MIGAWATAFLCTLAIELPIAALVLRAHVARARTLVAVLVALNLATHPTLWFVVPEAWHAGGRLVVVETAIALVEALGLRLLIRSRRPTWTRSLAAALCANAASFLIGAMLL